MTNKLSRAVSSGWVGSSAKNETGLSSMLEAGKKLRLTPPFYMSQMIGRTVAVTLRITESSDAFDGQAFFKQVIDTWKTALGTNLKQQIDIIIEVAQGVTIISKSHDMGAIYLYDGDLAEVLNYDSNYMPKVTLINYGNIIGRGGDGGTMKSQTNVSGAGQDGGAAIHNAYVGDTATGQCLNIDNRGLIAGGGGGGGALYIGKNTGKFKFFFAGGGGAPFGAGGVETGGSNTGNGTAATRDVPGKGAVNTATIRGGNGGAWGNNGEDAVYPSPESTDIYKRGKGGSVGFSVYDQEPVFINRGEILGAIGM